jgi:signal transduction histidine kinase
MGGVAASPLRALTLQPSADLVLSGLCAVAGLAGVALEYRGAVPPVPPLTGGLLLALATSGLVAWRRRAPVAVSCAVTALCLGYHLAGYPGLAPGAAMFAAIYAVTTYAGGRRLLKAAALVVAIGAIPELPPHPAGWSVGALLGPPVGMLAAAAMGEAARARRVAVAEELRVARQTAAEDARRKLIEERLNIARELHDVLAHTITVISVQAAVGAEALDGRPEDARAALAAVRAAAREATTELRSALVLLRAGKEPPAVTPSQPGLAHLPQLIEQASGGGLTVRLTVEGDTGQLPAAVGLAAYRIVQEALTNVIRHSAATTAEVVIKAAPDAVTVEVTDEGPAATVPGTAGKENGVHGLTGMRERARMLGGTLRAGPSPGTGFRVEARLPLRDPA